MKTNLVLFLLLISSFPAIAQTTDTTKTTSKKADKNIAITGIPTLSFNRSRGVGIGGLGMMFFKTTQDSATSPSRVILNAQYTTKNNWAVMAFSQLFLWDDFVRLSVGGGYFSAHFQTYQDIPDYGNMVEVPYANAGYFVFFSPLFQVYKHLYVGPTFSIMHTDVDFTLPDGTVETQKTNTNSWGLVSMYDTKNNQYNPDKGITAAIRYTNNPAFLGNDSLFNKLYVFVNYYTRLNESMVLASRFSGNIGLGDVPFASQSYVGGKDIRGYTQGQYRGNQTYAAQTELRWNFYKRWGVVGFFGLAMTVDPESQVLQGGGVGLRFKLIPKYNINAGIDGAVGKNDWGVYFRITEAF